MNELIKALYAPVARRTSVVANPARRQLDKIQNRPVSVRTRVPEAPGAALTIFSVTSVLLGTPAFSSHDRPPSSHAHRSAR